MTYEAVKKSARHLEFRTSNAPPGALLAGVGLLLASFPAADSLFVPGIDVMHPTAWPAHFAAAVIALLLYVAWVAVITGRERRVTVDSSARVVQVELTKRITRAHSQIPFSAVSGVTLGGGRWADGEKTFEVRLAFAGGGSELLGTFDTYFGALRCQHDVCSLIGCRAITLT